MAEIDNPIRTLIDSLSDLLETITSIRDCIKLLEEVESECTQQLSVLNEEHRQLADRCQWLNECLKKGSQSIPVESKPDYTDFITPPPPEPDLGPSRDRPQQPPPPKDLRRERKLELADHIEAFIPYDQRSIVMPTINALLIDPSRDVGDMLELIPWGPIWTERADWETTVEIQETRLHSWQTVLQNRRTYWQNRLQRLKDNGYDKLLQIKVERSEEWPSHLELLKRQEEANNAELRHTLEVLERKWAARQTEGEIRHDR